MTDRMAKGVLQPDGTTQGRAAHGRRACRQRDRLHGQPAARRQRAVHDVMATKMPFVGRGKSSKEIAAPDVSRRAVLKGVAVVAGALSATGSATAQTLKPVKARLLQPDPLRRAV
jgi:hypothetical protein